MAVKLRLVRMGKKKQPTYRVVAADSRSPRDGRFLEIVGIYAPRGRSTTDTDAVVTIDHAKAVKWLSQGAQPTDRVEKLLRASGAWDEFTMSGTSARLGSPGGPDSTAGAGPGSAPAEEPAIDMQHGEGPGGPDSTAGADSTAGPDSTAGAE